MSQLRPLPVLALSLACAASPAQRPNSNVDFCASIHRDTTIHLSEQLRSLESLMVNRTGVHVLEDGGGSMVARAWLSEYAERTIDVQDFIFSADNVGLIATDYLVRAADRGVRVRMLVDDVLVEADALQLLALDAHPNLEIRIYNPNINIGKSLPRKIFNVVSDFRGINQRMHNKAFIVDGRIAITGGRNIADEYFEYDHEFNFRDRDVLLLGGVVAQVDSVFEQYWNDRLSREVQTLARSSEAAVDRADRLEWLHQYACDPANYWPQVRERMNAVPRAFNAIVESGQLQWVDRVDFVSDVPGKNDGTEGMRGGGLTLDALLALVRNARTSITIQTPYLATTSLGRSAFRDAVNRGVEVRILTNSLAATDNLEAFSGYQRDRTLLLQTGVRIFEFRPDAAVRTTIMTGARTQKLEQLPIFAVHAKSMVIDGHITVIGTFNLDPRSANLNTESVAVIYSDEIAAGVLAGIELALQPESAWETTLSRTRTARPERGCGSRSGYDG